MFCFVSNEGEQGLSSILFPQGPIDYETDSAERGPDAAN